MADFQFNIAKGRAVELHDRVVSNDPANSALIVIPVDRGAETDAALKDLDTGAAVLAAVTERSTSGWSRQTLTDADLSASTTDDTNDRRTVAMPAVSWAGPTAGAVTDLLVCYDGDTTGGTDTNLVPVVMLAFAITPDGSQVTKNAGDYLRAS